MTWPLQLIQPTGWVDDQVFEPEEITEMDQRILTLANALRHQGLEQWQALAVLPDATLGNDASTGPGAYQSGVSGVGRVLCGYKVPGQGSPERRALAVFGRYDLAAQSRAAFSFGGGSWDFEQVGAFSFPVEHAVCTDAGVLLVTNGTARSVWRKVNYGSGWTEVTNVAGVGRGLIGLHMSPFSGRILAGEIGGNNTDRVLTSDDSGTTWVRREIGQPWAVRAFADDGAGTIIALCSTGISPKLAISTDDGATWLPVLNTSLPGDQNLLNDAGAGINDCSVAYVADIHNSFVVVTGGKIYRSQDGVAWTTRSSLDLSVATSPFSLNPSTPDPAVYNHFAAASGPCLALCANWDVTLPSPGSTKRPSVVYSFDLGDTWKLVDVGGPSSNTAKRVTQIREWNGRFVVGSQGVVYISGLVCAPMGVDFSADG